MRKNTLYTFSIIMSDRFTKTVITKTSGSMNSSKAFKTVTSSRGINNQYVAGSGVGSVSSSGARAKNRRARVRANNNSNNSNNSNNTPTLFPINVPPPPVALAPVITTVASRTLTTIVINFTQTSNSQTITNYKYSLDGGATYTAFSPTRIVSPLTLSGLTSGTSYNISIKAVSANGDSAASNEITQSTYTQVNYDRFTTVGAATWTAPAGVTEVEYLIVGGGGGSGSSYSKINVLGSILVTDTPQAGAYWINSANLTNGRYSGRMYYGYNSGQNSSSFADPVLLTASQNFTPNGVIYNTQKWYNFQMVYLLSGSLPISTNTTFVIPQGMPTTTYSNNVSGGSGGGGGGHIRSSSVFPNSKYTVVPGTTYSVYVGAGGAGGAASTNSEISGNSGEASSFDTLIAPGGAGGLKSRSATNGNGAGGNAGSDIMGGRGGAGGGRNGGNVSNSEVYQWNSTVLRGTYGGYGVTLNFDGNGNVAYGYGGDGGDPNTVATLVTPANVGKGGKGTGATLNSFAPGIDGGSGIVIIKYYT
jgi:hypothetical protein